MWAAAGCRGDTWYSLGKRESVAAARTSPGPHSLRLSYESEKRSTFLIMSSAISGRSLPKIDRPIKQRKTEARPACYTGPARTPIILWESRSFLPPSEPLIGWLRKPRAKRFRSPPGTARRILNAAWAGREQGTRSLTRRGRERESNYLQMSLACFHPASTKRKLCCA
ncbi:hypothetical protein SKAU_G00042040 [Synaphobranchus kaupii]|uniref:Uncharacterized protein n=1 Tax=Synaphobranchus kaupii TaxID=118154 RepID=A0A9Q1G1D2_SYNKA|nr:hypothetical protein SKAU_G00042040 [Synaphobranchus kaupii]